MTTREEKIAKLAARRAGGPDRGPTAYAPSVPPPKMPRLSFNNETIRAAAPRFRHFVCRIEMDAQGTTVTKSERVGHDFPTDEAANRYAFTRNLLEKSDALYVAKREAI